MTPAFLLPLTPLADTLRLGQPAADSSRLAAPTAPPTEPTAATDTVRTAAEVIDAGEAVESVEAANTSEAESSVQADSSAQAAAPQRSVPGAPAPVRTTTEAAGSGKGSAASRITEDAEILKAAGGSEAAPADTLVFSAADTLIYPAADTTLVAEPFDPTLTAGQTFGERSELTAGRSPVLPRSEQLTDHPVFQGIVLVLLIAYMLLLCAHLRDILGLFLRKRSDYLRDGGHALYNGRAIQTAVVVGLLTLAAVGVRLGGQSAGGAFHTLELLSLTTGAVFGVALVQCGALALIGRITLTTELTRAVIHFKALYFSVATLFAMPAALLLIFCPPGEGRFWFWTLCALSGSVALLFLKETFMLFLRKKISILHWFLYLCTVECFPISVVWLMAMKL